MPARLWVEYSLPQARRVRLRLSAGSLFFFFALSGILSAQSTDRFISDQVKALGGEKTLKGIASVELTGEARDPDTGATAAFTWVTRTPDHLYLEFSGLELNWSEAYNGRSAWRRDGGDLHTLIGHEAAQLRMAALLANTHLQQIKNYKLTVRYGGRISYQDRPVDILQIVDEGGETQQAYLDAATHFIVREQEADGSAIDFADYRSVDGVQLPFHLVLHLEPKVSGQAPDRTLEVEVRTARTGPAREEALFDFPRAADAAPLPDAAALLVELGKNQAAIERMQSQYTCQLTETDFSRDTNGHLHEKSTDEYEIFYLGRQSVAKHIANNGNPLSPAEQHKQDERVDKAFKNYDARMQKIAAQSSADAAPPDDSSDRDTIHIGDFLKASHFYNLREEVFRGHSVIVFDFDPKPSFKPHNLGQKMAHELAGAVWIDPQGHQITRLQAHTVGSIKVGGGLVATVGTGSEVAFEQDKVSEALWMPVYSEVHLSLRLLLVKGMKLDEVDRFHDYKRFSVTTTFKVIPDTSH